MKRVHSFIYTAHAVSSIVFVAVILFPYVAMNMKKRESSRAITGLKLWHKVLWVSHFFLVLLFITGMWLTPDFLSIWFWTVILTFLALGAMLGIVTKQIRLLIQKGATSAADFDRVIRPGIILSVAILIQFIMMSRLS